MERKIKIPFNIKFRIYFGLLITLALFISVYVFLYYIGDYFLEWGLFFVIVGFIPLIFALFVKHEDRGYKIKESDFSRLFKLIKEVSKDLGVKMPDEIHLLSTDEIYVTGLFKRKLGIGVVALRELSPEEFKSILVHEFGHLYGNDTIVGALLSKIQISLDKSSKFGKAWWDYVPFAEFAIIGLAITGFAKGYTFLFNVILSIYSRQVEYRADYVASSLSGKETFGVALLNYSAYVTYFNEVGYNTIINQLYEGREFVNIYESVYDAYKKEDIKRIRKLVFENDKGGIFSSHPILNKRLSSIGLSKIDIKINKGKKNALSFIDKSEQVEKELTKILTDKMHVNLLYADAVQREGKCRHCGEQFEKLNELLEHESKCNRTFS